MIENENEKETWKETWKDIPGYEGLYLVSNTGKVKSMNYKQSGVPGILTTGDSGHGYQCIYIYNVDKKRRKHYVHRLVWEAFNGPIPKGMQVNHKDENKSNNSLENLELMTPKQNSNFGTRTVRIARSLSKPIAQIDMVSGEILKEYPSVRCARNEYGNSIANAVIGRGKQAYGFKWKYLSDL